MRRLLILVMVGVLAGAIRPDVRAQAWTLDPTVAPVLTNEPSVLPSVSFVPLVDGRVIAVGTFTHINATPALRLARLRTDGTLDPSFTANLTDVEFVSRVAPLSDGRYVAMVMMGVRALPDPMPVPIPPAPVPTVIGDNPATNGAGSSTGGLVIGPAANARLFRLGASGQKDTNFAPLLVEGGIPQLIPLDGGRVLIWGTFRSVGGAPRNGLARLNADGTVDATFAPALTAASLNVSAAAAAPDGAVVVSGVGYPANGRATYILARLLPNGEIDSRFAPGIVGAGFTLLAVLPDGSVLAGNGNLSRYSPTGALDRDYRVQIPNLRSITTVAGLPGGRLAVEALVGTAPAVFTLRADGSVERDFRRINGASEGQWLRGVFPDGRVLVLQGALVTSSFLPSPMTPQTGTAPAIGTTTATGGATAVPVDVSVAVPTLIGTTPAISNGTAVPANVSVIAPVFIGPTFYQPALAITSTDTASITVLPSSFTQQTPGTVSQIEIDASDRALVAGTFTHVNGQPRSGLARFLANGALDASFVPAGERLLFAPADGRAIASRTVLGPMTSDGYHRLTTQIIRLQSNGEVDGNFAFPAELNAATTNWLAVEGDGRMLISAFEPDASGEANLKLIRLGFDGRRASTLPTKFSGFTRIYPVPLGTTVVAGGTSPSSPGSDSGGPVGVGVPITPPDIVGPPVIMPPYNIGLPNPIDAVRIVAGQRLLVAGAFSHVNGIVRSNLARLNSDGTLDPTYVPPLPSPTPYAATPDPAGVAVMPVDPAMPIAIRPSNTAIPLADGRAIVFTSTLANGRWLYQTVRLRADASIDPTFQPVASFSGGGRELRDGTFFVNGRRYTADGALDRNFAPRLGSPPGSGYAGAGAMDSAGRLWIGGYFDQVTGQPRSALARFTSSEIVGITFSPVSRRVVAGRNATFEVVIGTNRAATYQWTHDGKDVPGATRDTLTIPRITTSDAGTYRVTVTIGAQRFTSDPAVLTVVPNTGRLINFSARSRVDGSGAAQIAGMVCSDTEPRPVLLRAVGRGLPGSTGAAMLPVPVLSLHDRDRIVAEDRGGITAAGIAAMAREVGAFPVAASLPGPDLIYGSALTFSIGASGSFTASTTSGDGRDGISLFELYDTGSTTAPPLIRNLAIRGRTGTGANVLTAGFVIAGNGPLRLLLRGIGPGLAAFGVTGAAADPSLAVFAAGESEPMAENDDWTGAPELVAAAASVRAFPLPSESHDAALLVDLEPGAFTAQLTTSNNATGEAMIEIYVIAPP